MKIVTKIIACLSVGLFLTLSSMSDALSSPANHASEHSLHASEITIDRIELVNQQINLLKGRLSQEQLALLELEKYHEKAISQLVIEKASKNLVDKAMLEIAVARSNLDSLKIELADAIQTVSWLEKSTQEMQTQLNVISIFGKAVAEQSLTVPSELRLDLHYQQKLLSLEKTRIHYLQNLQTTVNSILELRRESFNRINTLLKSRKILLVKQQQNKDELAFQLQQNHWLQEVNHLYTKLEKIDPIEGHEEYLNTERDIFFTNENANFAYLRSLMARYSDQIEQMKLVLSRTNSISLLNEMSDQVLNINKQLTRLDQFIKSRVSVLDKHLSILNKKKSDANIGNYLQKLETIQGKYKTSIDSLQKMNASLAELRASLDQDLQMELSLRQGFPMFSLKTLMDLGREMLLVPALTFQVIKSLSTNLIEGFNQTYLLGFCIFAVLEVILITSFLLLRKLFNWLSERPSAWRKQINSKWLSLQWIRRNLLDLFLVGNVIGIFLFFNIPVQNFIFIGYLALVWLIFKTILTVLRVSLVEMTNDGHGRDMQLYRRLKIIILIGSLIVAFTVFAHQLPLIYDLKMLCDRIFLLFIMILSLLLLRSYDVIPNLILSHIQSPRPRLRRIIFFMGILIPLLMLSNSFIGLIGYMNLIMTVFWYEGVFLLMFLGYLIARALISDGVEQLSRLVIQYSQNGWLLTEAFLKPLDRILRVILFLSAWALLFLIYGWDQQSPMFERLLRLLNYQVVGVLNTTITPFRIFKLVIVVSIFYWTAKWTREFVYRFLLSRTKDMGIRNSFSILSQYAVIIIGLFISLRVLGIDFKALAVVAGMFAFGIGLGLRDLGNNFASGFLILLERPLRVGDIVSIAGVDGDVTHIGSRAITVRTWDHMEYVVPNTEVFNKSFINWTAKDNNVRSIVHVKTSRHDNPHSVRSLIQEVLTNNKYVLKNPAPEVYLKEMTETVMDFELRYFVNIRQVASRVSVTSEILMNLWDTFATHGIKPPYPQHEVYLRRGDSPKTLEQAIVKSEFVQKLD